MVWDGLYVRLAGAGAQICCKRLLVLGVTVAQLCGTPWDNPLPLQAAVFVSTT
jgi:hypothetical protein